MRFSWRVDGPVRRIRARVALLPAGGGRALSIALGTRRAGTRNVRTWTPRAGHVAPGSYTARLHATGARGAKLRRTARASGRLTLEVTAGSARAAPAVPGRSGRDGSAVPGPRAVQLGGPWTGNSGPAVGAATGDGMGAGAGGAGLVISSVRRPDARAVRRSVAPPRPVACRRAR